MSAGELPSKTLVEALVAAQKEMKNPPLNGFNPHFKSKFATLLDVRDTVVPVFNRHGIYVSQEFGITTEGAPVLDTVLRKGTEMIVSRALIPPPKDIQGWAASATYIRRVSLLAIAGVVGDPDADAEDVVRPPAPALKVSPYPDGPVDPEIAAQYADAFRTQINVANHAGIYTLHNELSDDVNKPLYAAVGALLNTKEKAALRSAVANKGQPF